MKHLLVLNQQPLHLEQHKVINMDINVLYYYYEMEIMFVMVEKVDKHLELVQMQEKGNMKHPLELNHQ